MQESWSTAMTGLETSVPRPDARGSPCWPALARATPNRPASASSSLSPVVACLASSSRAGWSDSSITVSTARLRSSSGVAVVTSMPFSHARTQDAANAGAPTSTTHIRQTPTGS